ncbi:outer membrane protein, partial [Bradyrhizobium ottawaense]
LSTPTGGTEEKVLHTRFGWTAGGGVEYAFAPHWSARLEYLYSKFDNANVTFPSGAQYSSSMDFQSLRIGLNRKIDWPGVPTY